MKCGWVVSSLIICIHRLKIQEERGGLAGLGRDQEALYANFNHLDPFRQSPKSIPLTVASCTSQIQSSTRTTTTTTTQRILRSQSSH
jgi:hypothetical protein